MTTVPYDWIRTLPAELAAKDEVPLFGYPPPFPWEKFGEALALCFEAPGFRLVRGEMRWQKAEELLNGIGDAVMPLQIHASGISSPLFWLLSEAAVTRLSARLLAKSDEWVLQASDGALLQGFYSFAAAEALHLLGETGYAKDLAFQIGSEKSLPQEAAFSCDVSLELDNKTLAMGRLLLTESFLKGWKEHFSVRSLTVPISPEIELSLHMQIGKSLLTLEEWQGLLPGDVLLPDQCNPEEILLTLNDRPLFYGERKDGAIQIVKRASYSEEVMDKQETTLSADQIPLSIAVEVGRLQLTAQKLLELQPGNLLELNVRPEDGVDLVIGGKVVAKGELIRIGESLGVRIL